MRKVLPSADHRLNHLYVHKSEVHKGHNGEEEERGGGLEPSSSGFSRHLLPKVPVVYTQPIHL